jgi:hypothetical protein
MSAGAASEKSMHQDKNQIQLMTSALEASMPAVGSSALDTSAQSMSDEMEKFYDARRALASETARNSAEVHTFRADMNNLIKSVMSMHDDVKRVRLLPWPAAVACCDACACTQAPT